MDRNKGETAPAAPAPSSSSGETAVPGTPFSERTLVQLEPEHPHDITPTPNAAQIGQSPQSPRLARTFSAFQEGAQAQSRAQAQAASHTQKSGQSQIQPFEALGRARSIPGEEGIIPLARHGSHFK